MDVYERLWGFAAYSDAMAETESAEVAALGYREGN